MLLSELVSYIDDYLDVKKIPDCSLNGLQVEGFKECQSIATAATASLEAIDAAIESGLTLNPITIAFATCASVTSDSVTPPTFE